MSNGREEFLVATVGGVLLVLLMAITGLIIVGMKARWCAIVLATVMAFCALYKANALTLPIETRFGTHSKPMLFSRWFRQRTPFYSPFYSRVYSRVYSGFFSNPAPVVHHHVERQALLARFCRRVRGCQGGRVALLGPPEILLLPAALDSGRTATARRAWARKVLV